MIRAVVFDLDGVLLDSEHLWDEVRRDVVDRHGGRWRDEATADMQGMSSVEWTEYMRDRLGMDLSTDQIGNLVVSDLVGRYRRQLPLVPGAVEAVRRMARRWPLALASSSNRVVIDEVLEVAGLADLFAVTVSSEEVARGKPQPDVYREATRRLGQPPASCVAVEDSGNGIRSAHAAGLHVIAVPNPRYPPSPEVLQLAEVVLDRLDGLDTQLVEELGTG